MAKSSNLGNPDNLTYQPETADSDWGLTISPTQPGDGIYRPFSGNHKEPFVLRLYLGSEVVGWSIFIGNRIITFRPDDIIDENKD